MTTDHDHDGVLLLDEIVRRMLADLADHEAFDSETVEAIRRLADAGRLASTSELRQALEVNADSLSPEP